jgi:hypothetical protein
VSSARSESAPATASGNQWMGEVATPSRRTYAPRMRDIDTIDSELRLVAALRHAAGERGGPLPSIDVADALLDKRRELAEGLQPVSLEASCRGGVT